MKRILIFASGSGTNAQNIIKHFKNTDNARVTSVFTNNQNAGVIEKAAQLGVPSVVFSKEELLDGSVSSKVISDNPDLIVLAGFLLKFPDDIIARFPNKIINIHPALLPKFGGKGMWGHHVHEAVLKSGEKESGATVHFVTSGIDEGKIILQKSFKISPNETVESLADKVHQVEYSIFPEAINMVLKNN